MERKRSLRNKRLRLVNVIDRAIRVADDSFFKKASYFNDAIPSPIHGLKAKMNESRRWIRSIGGDCRERYKGKI